MTDDADANGFTRSSGSTQYPRRIDGASTLLKEPTVITCLLKSSPNRVGRNFPR